MRAIRYQTTTGEDRPAGAQRVQGDDPDGYVDRLVKFIPAETLTLFTAVAVYAGARDTPAMLLTALVITLLATPLYLFVAGRQLPANQRPRLWMYPLSMLAFIIWATFTNQAVRTLPEVDVDEEWATFILIVGVLTIPAIDQALGAVLPRNSQAS